MTYPAVVDSSTLIALVRGGVLIHLGQFFQPLFMGSGAEKECRRRPSIDIALSQAQAANQACFKNRFTLLKHGGTETRRTLRGFLCVSSVSLCLCGSGWVKVSTDFGRNLKHAEIYGWFTEGFDTKDLQEALALLKELA